jgi:hypothetical protein
MEWTMVRALRLSTAAGLVLCLACAAAWADTLKFTATLEPEKTGAAKGTATLTVDTAKKMLAWSIDYSGLTAPPAMAAILSPPPDAKSDPGTTALTLPAKPTSPISGTGFKTGQWIILIGNKTVPEIGGQIKPAP